MVGWLDGSKMERKSEKGGRARVKERGTEGQRFNPLTDGLVW